MCVCNYTSVIEILSKKSNFSRKVISRFPMIFFSPFRLLYVINLSFFPCRCHIIPNASLHRLLNYWINQSNHWIEYFAMLIYLVIFIHSEKYETMKLRKRYEHRLRVKFDWMIWLSFSLNFAEQFFVWKTMSWSHKGFSSKLISFIMDLIFVWKMYDFRWIEALK